MACSNNIERDRQRDREQAQKPASINGERYIVCGRERERQRERERERERIRVFKHLKKLQTRFAIYHVVSTLDGVIFI